MAETVKGLKALLGKLENLSKDAEKEVFHIAEANANEIAAMAKLYAPKDDGYLAGSINAVPVSKKSWKVVVGAEYGAYVEFGTKSKVQIPAEMSKLAAEFRGKGRGDFKKMLDNLRQWCRNKGIPQEAAYPIAISILRYGRKPQPYLYPAFVKGRRQYLKDLTQYLKVDLKL